MWGKPVVQSNSATPVVLPHVDEALVDGDKGAKEHYIRDAFKQKMFLSAHTFSWNEKDWIISGWPPGVRPLMDPKRYRVSELNTLCTYLAQITFVSAVLPSKNQGVDVALTAKNALISVIHSYDSLLSSSDGSSSCSSSSPQSNTRDRLKLDSQRLKMIVDYLPSLLEMPLDELQSKLSPFSS